MFAIFRKRDFSLMWLAQLISTIGSALTDLAAGILVWNLTGSALNVGLVLIVAALPTLFVGLFAGVFVDRFDRKRILLLSDLLRAGIVVLIPIAFNALGNDTGMVAMYGLLLLSATVRQFFDPAWESVLPEIASEEELGRANSFLAISSFGSTAIGFARKDSARSLADSQPLIGPPWPTKTRGPMRGQDSMISIAKVESGTLWPLADLALAPGSTQPSPSISLHFRSATSPRRCPVTSKSCNAAPNG